MLVSEKDWLNQRPKVSEEISPTSSPGFAVLLVKLLRDLIVHLVQEEKSIFMNSKKKNVNSSFLSQVRKGKRYIFFGAPLEKRVLGKES